jgi:hypothetical protein
MVVSEISWSKGSKWVLAIGLGLELVLVGALVGKSEGAAIGLPLTVFFFAFAALVLGLVQTVRVAVEGMDLIVGFKLFRRRIPLHTIDRVSPVRYRWLQWGGWGIRYRWGAVLYNVPGDQGRAVELTLRNGKKVLFSARDPEAVCTAIREQRALMPA